MRVQVPLLLCNRGPVILILSTLLSCPSLQAQENIPIGTFRHHVSYNHIHDIAFDGVTRTFAAAAYGIQVFNRADLETSYYSKATGLSGGAITAIAFDNTNRKLIVAYRDGYFDVVDDRQQITKFDPAANTPSIGSREINDVEIAGNVAFLATAYGVVLFDLGSNRVRGTWRDLGIDGQSLAVRHVSIRSDSVFLATTQGILAGRMSDNLHDFRKWKRYMHWPFSNNVSGLAVWNDVVYAAVDDAGVFKLSDGTWTSVDGVPAESYFSLQASATLLLTAASGLYEFHNDGSMRHLVYPSISQPVFATVDEGGKKWIGDRESGLFELNGEHIASLLPDCPANEVVTNVSYADGKVFAVGGGNDAGGRPLQKGVIDIFERGTWATQVLPVADIGDVQWMPSTGTLYASSLAEGVAVKRNGAEVIVYNETNSTLRSSLPNGPVKVTALANAGTAVWAINYGVQPVLHRIAPDNSWTSYAVALPASQYGQKIVVDGSGNIWMSIDPARGGGLVVFNPDSGNSRLLTDVAGQGGLPVMAVHSLCLDRDGSLWIGTAAGVAYIPNAGAILQVPADVIKPIANGRFVLRDDVITSIAVDGGNRKWFGTQRGIWLFNSFGDEPLTHFTSANSLLPSDNILDIDINQQTGEVFMATGHGLVSYRAGATAYHDEAPVKIFPNPVTPAFVGVVGITGTPTDATVKITDASGKLVWETRANGSTATWNLLDGAGRHVPSGVYIVYTISQDGSQREAGKLAVIN